MPEQTAFQTASQTALLSGGDALVALMALVVTAVLLDLITALFRDEARLSPGGMLAARLAEELERRLNRPGRGATTLAVRGGLCVAILFGAAVGAGSLLVMARAHLPGGDLWLLLGIMACLNIAAPGRLARAIAASLQREDMKTARALVTGLSERASDLHDAGGLTRLSVEQLAHALLRGLVAPVFWLLLAGPVAMVLVTAASGAHAAIGLRTGHAGPFSGPLRIVSGLLLAPPAVLVWLLLSLACLFVPGLRPWAALKSGVALHDGARASFSFLPVATMAGGLAMALPVRDRAGSILWAGEAESARGNLSHIRRASLAYSLCVVFVLLGLLWGIARVM